MPLVYQFNNGDIVEIITRSNSQPSRDWLNFVKTSHAQNRIKSFFRKLHFAESVAKGREMVEKELERLGHEAVAAYKNADIAAIAKSLNYHTEDDLYAAIGYGHVALGTVINKLKIEEPSKKDAIVIEAPKPSGKKRLAVTLDGIKNMMITRAKCCAPLPGEEVVGYVTRGKGVALHSISCPNVQSFREREPERLVNISWTEPDSERYSTDIRIKAVDRVGLLNEITAVLSEARLNIAGAKVRSFAR